MNANIRTKCALTAMLLLFSFVWADQNEDTVPQKEYELTVTDICKTDYAHVIQINIEAPLNLAPEERLTTLEYRWKDKYSAKTSNGIHEKNDHNYKARIALVAQMTPISSMVLFTTSQESNGQAPGFCEGKLTSEKRIDDVVTFRIASGKYSLGKRLRIGQLGDDPIYLTVGEIP